MCWGMNFWDWMILLVVVLVEYVLLSIMPRVDSLLRLLWWVMLGMSVGCLSIVIKSLQDRRIVLNKRKQDGGKKDEIG